MTLPPHDVFAAGLSERAPLIDALRTRIAREGRITFRDFMEAALYDPEHGYYATHGDAATARGDFVTSPEVHPVFGALVGKQIWQMWDVMGRPGRFDVVELGGGSGTLARGILDWAREEQGFSQSLRYRIVERRGSLPVATSGDGARDIEWIESLPGDLSGCVLSNEFFDALPVHRVRNDGGRSSEVYVGLDGGRFVETFAEISTPEIERYFERAGVIPGDGCFAEVNLDAERWMRDVARSMRHGYVLTFDYGYEASELYAPWRRDGTLRCFYRQSISSDPYQRIGMQDMTSSVDFTALRAAGESGDLQTIGATDQSRFLTRLGIAEGMASVARSANLDLEEYFARRNVVLDLIDPAKLGRIRVLAQAKNAPSAPLAGFSDGE